MRFIFNCYLVLDYTDITFWLLTTFISLTCVYKNEIATRNLEMLV